MLQRLIAITMRDTSVETETDLYGSGGLEAARANPTDLIVLDLGLPDMSGWRVLERLRAEPATLETPVVITTGDIRGSIAHRAATLDAVTLEKPYTGGVLRATTLMTLEPWLNRFHDPSRGLRHPVGWWGGDGDGAV